MKRTNYLVATILAAIVLAGQLVLNAWETLVLIRVFLGGPFPVDALLVLGIQGLIDAVILVAFILTLVGIKYIGKDKETFKKGKALIITNIVFIFLVIAILVYTTATASASVDPIYIIINWASVAVLLVANILYIVDLAKEKNRGDVAQTVETQPEQPKEEPVAVEETKVETAPAKTEEKPVVKKTTKKEVATKSKPVAKSTSAKKPAEKKTVATKVAKPAEKTATKQSKPVAKKAPAKTTEKKATVTKTTTKKATTTKKPASAKKTTTTKKVSK